MYRLTRCVAASDSLSSSVFLILFASDARVSAEPMLISVIDSCMLIVSSSFASFRFLRPPLLLWTKTQSISRNLQLEHVLVFSGIIFVPSEEVIELTGSPSHLIFFSRHDKHALLATLLGRCP